MPNDYDSPTKAPYYEGGISAVLIARKEELTKQIKAVDDAITALDENPGVEKVLNILRKVGI